MYKHTWQCESCAKKRKGSAEEQASQTRLVQETPKTSKESKQTCPDNQRDETHRLDETESRITLRKKPSQQIERNSVASISDDDLSVLGDTINSDMSFKTNMASEPVLQISISQLKTILDEKLKNNNQALIADLKNTILTEITNSVADIKRNMEQTTKTFVKEQNAINDKVKKIDAHIQNLEAEQNNMKAEIRKLQDSITKPAEVNPTQNQCQETEENKKKLVLYGFMEHPYENEYDLLQRISHAFHDILELNINPYIETVRRIGKIGFKRPIEIELISKRMVNYLLQNSHCFQNTGLSVSEFVSGPTLQQRNHLRQALREARRSGRKANIRGNKLYIEGQEHIEEEKTENTTSKQDNTNMQSRIETNVQTRTSTPPFRSFR